MQLPFYKTFIVSADKYEFYKSIIYASDMDRFYKSIIFDCTAGSDFTNCLSLARVHKATFFKHSQKVLFPTSNHVKDVCISISLNNL